MAAPQIVDKPAAFTPFKGHLPAFLKPEHRVIEFGLSDATLALHLIESGHTRYLGMVSDESVLRHLTAVEPRLESYLAVWDGTPEAIFENNADVLVLNGQSALTACKFSMVQHAQYVVLAETGLPPQANWAWKINSLMSRQNSVESFKIGKNNYRAAEVRNRKKRALRRYISPVPGLENFYESLNAQSINYVILRWFEDLPELAPGDDIDMLVADEDYERLQKIFTEQPGSIPCDIYSVSGINNSSYNDMAYYPPHLAKQMLAESRLWEKIFRVPNATHYFLSLAYHAVYHKGPESGLQSKTVGVFPNGLPKHDFKNALQKLAADVGIKVSGFDMEGIENCLAEHGWRPPNDTLHMMARYNHWVKKRFPQQAVSAQAKDRDLCVFMIRNRAFELNFQDDIVAEIARRGFNVLEVKDFSEEESRRVGRLTRGGNWTEDTGVVTGGGLPRRMVVAVDLNPIEPDAETQQQYPSLTNQRMLEKLEIRKLMNARLYPVEKNNLIHATDCESEAWDYIDVALPAQREAFLKQMADWRTQYQWPYPVVKQIDSPSSRARLAEIEFNGKPACIKQYRPGTEAFLQRELAFIDAMHDTSPLVPEVLARGENYYVFKPYEFSFKNNPSLEYGRLLTGLYKAAWEQGYAIVGHQPNHWPDFEFVYQYPKKPLRFEEGYDVQGCPKEFAGETPVAYPQGVLYQKHWQPLFGVALNSLLNDPAWLQVLKRVGYLLLAKPRQGLKAFKENSRLWRRKWLNVKAWRLMLLEPVSRMIERSAGF